jgi:hypothetical protein
MEYEILEILGMFLLSLWKVYIAYGYFVFESYNFFVGAIVVSLAVLCANILCYFFYARIQNKNWFLKFSKSRGYLRGQKFYAEYGFYLSTILAPIFLGIPTITLISLAMNVSNRKILAGLILSSLFWGGVIYLSFHYSLGLFNFKS